MPTRKKKGAKPPSGFHEQYIVKLDYQQTCGFWIFGHKLTVEVWVPLGAKEKCNHDKAAEQARTQFPGCRIQHTTYC